MRPQSNLQGKEKVNLVVLLTYAVIGVCVALIAANAYYAMSCPVTNPDAIEGHINAIGHRLKVSEYHIKQNNRKLVHLLGMLQKQTTPLSRDDLGSMEKEAKDEAIRIALDSLKFPAPELPFDIVAEYGPPVKESEVHVVDDDYIGGGKKNLTESEQGDDFYDPRGEIQKTDTGFSQAAKNDKERFGGTFHQAHSNDDGSKDYTDGKDKAKQNDDGFGNDVSNSGGKEGKIFRDNLSDEAATHLCNEWKEKYKVVLGKDWGTLPFDLQHKWLQYACDYMLTKSN